MITQQKKLYNELISTMKDWQQQPNDFQINVIANQLPAIIVPTMQQMTGRQLIRDGRAKKGRVSMMKKYNVQVLADIGTVQHRVALKELNRKKGKDGIEEYIDFVLKTHEHLEKNQEQLKSQGIQFNNRKLIVE